MLDCKPCSTPVKMGRQLSLYDGTLLDDPTSYRQEDWAWVWLDLGCWVWTGWDCTAGGAWAGAVR